MLIITTIAIIYAIMLGANVMLNSFFPRLILNREGTKLYLSRYYLFGLPKMPDGSYPFEPTGAFKDGAKERKLFGVAPYLHKIHLSDNADALHNHPWKWSFSIVLWRGYYEDRLTSDLKVERRRVYPGMINIISENDYHRLDLVDGKPAWTIFVTGPRVKNWGFWSAKAMIPWKVFLSGQRKGKKDELQA